MTYIFAIFCLLIIFSCSKKHLQESDIQKILDNSKDFKEYTLKKNFEINFPQNTEEKEKANQLIKNENYKSFYETDFNNDGYPDYLLNLERKPQKDSTLMILPIGEYKEVLILLSKNRNDFDFVEIEPKDVYFDIIGAKPIKNNLFGIMKIKLRILEKDGYSIFEKINLEIKDKKISEIAKNENLPIKNFFYSYYGGWTGLNFVLNLKKDSTILYSINHKDFTGKYFAKSNHGFEKFSKKLNEIGFKNLKNKYSRDCNDCSANELNIFYGSDQKNIYDYGSKGSLELVRLYNSLDSLIEKQNWQKIN